MIDYSSEWEPNNYKREKIEVKSVIEPFVEHVDGIEEWLELKVSIHFDTLSSYSSGKLSNCSKNWDVLCVETFYVNVRNFKKDLEANVGSDKLLSGLSLGTLSNVN